MPASGHPPATACTGAPVMTPPVTVHAPSALRTDPSVCTASGLTAAVAGVAFRI